MSQSELIEAFLNAVSKLPASPGVSYHWANDEAAAWGGTTDGILATSQSIRVATQNFSASVVYCIVGRSGRDISALSRYPDEAEVVFLPGTTLLARGARMLDGVRVVVLEELDVTADVHPAERSVDELFSELEASIFEARRAAPIGISTPEKFLGPIPLMGSASPATA